eukprot:scaffold721_cov131-Cylindrotheca_fusiformis.AAC.17
MVTWGQNTTHVFGGTPSSGPAPAFGAPAPAPSGGGLFGSSPAPASGSLFGTPAPAPGGSLFGSSPNNSGSLFGSNTPAPAPGLFGAPSPGGSLFGASSPAPSGSLFGASPASSGLFGTPAPAGNNPAQTQIPAQAALQAHMDASARQEADRVRSKLETLHMAYTGSTVLSQESNPFVTIVYNDLTPEQRQMQWVHGMGSSGRIVAPPRPPQVSEAEWNKAVVNNPDPQNYMPVALVGGVALQARVSWQQDRAKALANYAASVRKSHETIQERTTKALEEINQKLSNHKALQKKMLQVMKRVELARCMNQPLQPDEFKALQRLQQLLKQVEAVKQSLISLQDTARTQTATRRIATGTSQAIRITEQELVPVLTGQRQKLETLMKTAMKDSKDAQLIGKRVAAMTPSIGY